MALPFFTIGHSTRSIGEFVELLTASEVGLVVDVRSASRSRTNPQYNLEVLPKSLSEFQISYEHIAEFGGLRPRAHDIAPSVNAFLENQSFHNYADYAMSAGFQSGLAKLRERGSVKRCAVMCAEAVWWRCHRRIITDYRLAAGENVFHILGPGKIMPASLARAAKRQPDRTLIYPIEAARTAYVFLSKRLVSALGGHDTRKSQCRLADALKPYLRAKVQSPGESGR